jgi:hypothetical protein
MKPDPGQSDERRIDFIVVGAQKAGTTALFEHLGDHPQIGLSDVKEVHFFDDEARNWENPDYEDYHQHFDWQRPLVRGEATPIYAYWPQGLERIRAYNPTMKLILMLRDPAERAWSHWRMEQARGVETGAFSWCIRQGRQRLFDANPWGHHREFSYVERGFCGDQLARLSALFPAEQLLVLQAEELLANPGSALAKVMEFLGVDVLGDVAARQVHVGPELGQLPPIDEAYLREIYAADQARLAAQLAGLRQSH